MEARDISTSQQWQASKEYRFLLARHNDTGTRLFDLGEVRVMPAADAVEAIEREGSLTLTDLIDSDEPILLVGMGALRRLWEEGDRPEDEVGPSSRPLREHSDSGPAATSSPQRAATAAQPLTAVPAGHPAAKFDGTQPNGRIRRAIDFMRVHSKEPISLDDVSRVACVSPCYFCKLFRKETGTTYSKYLASIRIEEATALLLSSDLNVTEICFRVGFNDLTHFERVFRNRIGLTPSRFRAQTV